MAKVKVSIKSTCSDWRADLHNTANPSTVPLPNIDHDTTVVLTEGAYYVSFGSFGNTDAKTATIAVSTSAADKIQETYGVDDHGRLFQFFGFVVKADGTVA